MSNTWLYHPTKPAKMVSLDDEEALNRMVAEGWKDTPAAFKDEEQAGDDKGDDAGGLTAEQEALLGAFRDAPDSLNKDELVLLGKGLGLKLMKAWKEPTLINKLQEHLDGHDQKAN